MFWDAKISASGIINDSISDDGTDITFGFGANFGVSETVAIRAEFEKFQNIGNESTTGRGFVFLESNQHFSLRHN